MKKLRLFRKVLIGTLFSLALIACKKEEKINNYCSQWVGTYRVIGNHTWNNPNGSGSSLDTNRHYTFSVTDDLANGLIYWEEGTRKVPIDENGEFKGYSYNKYLIIRFLGNDSIFIHENIWQAPSGWHDFDGYGQKI